MMLDTVFNSKNDMDSLDRDINTANSSMPVFKEFNDTHQSPFGAMRSNYQKEERKPTILSLG